MKATDVGADTLETAAERGTKALRELADRRGGAKGDAPGTPTAEASGDEQAP